MARLAFAVYDPPSPGLPYMAIVLSDGDVILAEPVSSPEEAEELIQNLSDELAKLAAKQDKSPPKAAGWSAVRPRN